ncbi:MAG TPA: tyrosinase family protein [Thermoanaerobaculia bacterium]
MTTIEYAPQVNGAIFWSRWRTAVCAAILVFLSLDVLAQPAVRMSWETFAEDPARVQSLRNGVAVMKSRNTADLTSALYRTSWQYWGAMHGYFGPGSVFGTIEEAISDYQSSGADPSLLVDFDGITDLTPPDAIAAQVWGQCQHGTQWFFAWHRLYLYYFEQVLQQAAGDPTLRLPYWDYTNPANVTMPAAYTAPTYVNAAGQTVANPLYEPRRHPGWNVPTSNALDPAATNINDALNDTSFFDVSGQDVGFQNAIQDNVHGYVHCTVIDCPVTDMGAVGYSANDPIFWAHHANIDRMWDCWTSLGNANPTDPSYLSQSFSYVDATGALVTNTVADLSNGTIALGYVYEQASNCARGAAKPVLAPTARRAPMTAETLDTARVALQAPVVLGKVQKHVTNAAVTRKVVPLTGGTASATPRMLALRGHDALPVRTDLVLTGIRFENHPGTQYHVYLERTDDRTKRARVGTLSFFVSTAAAMNEHAGHHGATAMNRVFDVTDELRRIAGPNANLKQVHVVFEATTGRVNAKAGPRFNDKMTLTIGEIELRVTVVP